MNIKLMKQFIFSHILFATCLVICLSLTTPVSAQVCNDDYVDSVATVTVEFYHPSAKIDAPFSVSSSKKVIFAGGNLQYNAAQDKWRFAEHQYDVIGDDLRGGNVTGTRVEGVIITGTREDRATQDKWIDLFQWATSGYRNTTYETEHMAKDYGVPDGVCSTYGCEKRYVYQPWDFEDRGDVKGLNSNLLNLYKESLYNYYLYGNETRQCSDWAWYNPISNGGCEETDLGMVCYNSPHQWYVPTKDEMKYVAFSRPDAHDLIAFATLDIDGYEHHGIILLPDNWDWEIPGSEAANIRAWAAKWVANTPTTERQASRNEFKWDENVLTKAEWEEFESYGAVFLPAAGAMQFGDWHWYDGHGIVNEYGEYWTSSKGDGGRYNTIRFYTIQGVDYESNGKDRYGAFFFGGGGRSPLFSCAIRPVRTYNK